MIPLSSLVNGWGVFIGPASVFPVEFRNVNMTSKKAEKIILLFCKINYASILKNDLTANMAENVFQPYARLFILYVMQTRNDTSLAGTCSEISV